MSPPEKLPAARKRPAVNISLSERVLGIVDKRAEESGLPRSRVIEAAILATWGEESAVPEGSKGGFVQCKCGAGAFIDGGPDLDLTAPWECRRCTYARMGLRVPTYDEAAFMLNVPDVAPLLKVVRGWSAEGSRRFITVAPNGDRLGLAKAIRELDWKGSGYCPPRVGLASGELELVWTVD